MRIGKKLLSVYEFTDCVDFLLATYHARHNEDPDFSYRYLQKRAGYSSNSNHFWQILTRRMELSQQAARRYAKALGLSARERQFFAIMALMNQAKTDEDRNQYYQQLRQFSEFKNRAHGVDLRYEYYEKWYYPALRALVTLDGFKEEAGWMARQLCPAITAKQASDGIERLLKWGFLVRDEQGRLQQADPFIGSVADRADDGVAKLALHNYHRRMIELGSEAIESFSQKQRYVAGATLALSKRQVEEIRKVTERYLEEVNALVAEEEPIEAVYRLNVQLFPLAGIKKTK